MTNHTGTFAYVWHEVAVVVTFESDWRAAKQVLLEVVGECAEHLSEDAERTLRRAAREYFIFYSKLTPTVYTSVVGEGVQLTLRYLVAPRRVRGSEQDVWEAVLDRFAARDDIDLAYPTTRLYRNDLEGKPGAGGPPRAGRRSPRVAPPRRRGGRGTSGKGPAPPETSRPPLPRRRRGGRTRRLAPAPQPAAGSVARSGWRPWTPSSRRADRVQVGVEVARRHDGPLDPDLAPPPVDRDDGDGDPGRDGDPVEPGLPARHGAGASPRA